MPEEAAERDDDNIGCRVCLLYDAENIGGGAIRAREVLEALSAAGFHVISAAATCQTSVYDALGRVLPLEPAILSGSTPAGKEYEDILLATASGYFLCRALRGADSIQGIILASADKLLSMCLLPWLRGGFPTYIVGLRPFVVDQSLVRLGVRAIVLEDSSAAKTKAQPPPVFLPDRYRFNFANDSPSKTTGLEVVTVPVPREPMPRFIPFPVTPDELTIGSRTVCDIPLEYWTTRSGEIYSPHAFVGCTTSGWHIRSAKGHRARSKAVIVNDRFIDASRGNVPIQSGDDVTVGPFKFRFFAAPRERLGEAIEMAKDFEIISRIEQRLHMLISRVLRSVSKDWWLDMIPEDVRDRCEGRQKGERDEEHPFRFTQLPDLQNILLTNWDIFQENGLESIWSSKSQMRRAFNCLIRSRNLTMHPTRGGADENDRIFLERLCLAVEGLF
jgi:hypothetical protein